MSDIQTQQIVKNRPREYIETLKELDVRFLNTAKTYVPRLYKILMKYH